MAKIEGGVKLKWGTLTKIAKRRKVSMTHIRLVAKGEREGSAGVVAAILREFQKQALDESTGAHAMQKTA
jgi:hypothetical protein